jgi:glycerol-3-phosphate acyltransferase PlsX
MLVGLNGVVVKSHGSTDSIGFANAIKVSISLVENKINEKITAQINLVASSIDQSNIGKSTDQSEDKSNE